MAIVMEELVGLVRQDGEAFYWDSLKRANVAVGVYGASILVALALRAVTMDSPLSALLVYIILFGTTFWAGASQVPLLPFMGSKPVPHWITVIVLSLLGCGSLLWLAIFYHYNKKAKANLVLAVSQASAPPPESASPYPRQ